MIVSRERHFAFVHIPKTGGTSIRESLAQAIPDAVVRTGKWQHPLARLMKSELGERAWRESYTFAFVRNPWARFVSWYNAMRERPPLPNHERARDEIADFPEFLRRATDYGIPIWRGQRDWLTENDEVIVNFVGRYETLQRDFAIVCRHLGVSVPLAHANATTKVDYRDYYSRASRRLVAERCRRDIETFGYSFV